MTSDSLLLIGRETRTATEVLDEHAQRLRQRGVADDVVVATYEREPIRELRDQFQGLTADTVYAVPMCAAHTHETTDGVPAALSYVSGTVHYCEPLGGSPAITDVIEDRAASQRAPADDVSLVLVSFGNSSKPYHRQTTDYHAARLREQSDYGEVLTCYLLQNPAVECVRYNTTNDRSVAVPLFLARSEATEERIPAELELGRGGMDYAAPFGTHPRVTDAITAEVEKQRALGARDDEPAPSFERQLTQSRQVVATDGEGRDRQ